MLKKGFIAQSILILGAIGIAVLGSLMGQRQDILVGAPIQSQQRNIIPETDSEYYLGTTTPTTKAWKNLITDQICLAGDCQTSWSAGAGETNTASNLGTGLNIFDSKSSVDLRFNSIAAGSNITLSTTSNNNTIVIASTASGGGGADFTYNTDIGFGVTGSATTTKTQFTQGIHASGTSQFSNATSSLFTAVTGWFTSIFVGVDTLAEYIADTAGAFFTGNTETGITVTYQDADNTVDVVCDTASGSVFGCLAAADWTTFNNKVATTRALTVAGTSNQITSSAGAQDLSADRTWTLSLPSHVIFPGNFQVTRSTTTNATTTSLDILGGLTFGGVTGTTWPNFCATITGSADLCDGSDATGGGGGTGSNWEFTTNAFSQTSIRPTTTVNTVVTGTGTSTFAGGLSAFREVSAPYFVATSTATSSFVGGIDALRYNSTATSTLTGLRIPTGGLSIKSLVSCSEALETNAFGDVICGSDATAAGAANDFTFATTFATLSAASSSPFWFQGALFASSTSQFDGNMTVGHGQGGGKLGIGTTSPYAALSVVGETVSTYFTATSTTATSSFAGNISVTGNVQASALTSALILTGSTGIFAEYAGSTCTNQAVTAFSALGAATCTTITSAYVDSSILTTSSTLDSLSQTSLADPGSDQLVFWDDSDTQFEFISTLTGLAISGNTLTVNDVTCTDCLNATEIEDIYLLDDGDVGTGVYDFGGATSFEIPNAANPTVNTTGQIAVNTTAASSSVRYYDGTAERSLYPDKNVSYSFASSTLAYAGSYGTSGTTTLLLMNNRRPVTLVAFFCKTDTGTAFLEFTDGTNKTDALQCTTTGTSDDGSIANSTWTMREDFKISIGTQASNPKFITVSATIREDAD